jgi:protein TonB
MRTLLAVFVLSLLLVSAPSQLWAQQSSEGIRKIVTKTDPQYPSVARRMNIQGSVRIEILVAPNGTVKSLEVKGGHPLLADSAQNAVRQWKWEPASRETHESVEIKFIP